MKFYETGSKLFFKNFIKFGIQQTKLRCLSIEDV